MTWDLLDQKVKLELLEIKEDPVLKVLMVSEVLLDPLVKLV